MKKVKYLVLALLMGILLPGTCSAEGLVTKILKDLEKRLEVGSDLTAKVSLIQERARQGVRELELIYYRRDADDAFMLVFVSPEREKGNGYLRVKDNLWMYRRNTRTFQHLSRGDRVGDTEVSAEAFEKRKLTELYGPVTDDAGKEIYTEEMLGKIPVYKVEVRARVKDVSYPKHIYWVRRDNYLPLKQNSYSLSDTLMQTVYYLTYTTVQGRYIAVKSIYVDQFEKGNKTIQEITGITFEPVDDTVFTKAHLENLSK